MATSTKDTATKKPQTLTHSIAQTYLDCPRKYYWRYIQEIQTKATRDYLDIGSAFHRGIEHQSPKKAAAYFDDADIAGQYDADDLRKKKAMVRGMVRGALEVWDFDWIESWPEEEYVLPIVNPATGYPSRTFVDAGKKDGLVRDDEGLWLIEYKTASRIDQSYIERLYLDTQITRYFRSVEKTHGETPQGVIYRVAKKPYIRQRQNETIREYCQRLEQDFLDRPGFYYFEERLYRSSDDVQEFEWDLWSVAKMIRHSERNEFFPKNTRMCSEYGGCEYIPLCTGQEGAEELYEHAPERNPELERVGQ